jgi:hypothetical protein
MAASAVAAAKRAAVLRIMWIAPIKSDKIHQHLSLI